MTELHEGAIKSAIRVLVDNCVSHVDDLTYKVTHLIADPDTVAEMHRDIDELNGAINFLRDSGTVRGCPRDHACGTQASDAL